MTIRRQSKAAALALLLCLTGCAIRQPAVSALDEPGYSSLAATPYYIEFHSRLSIISGHTYLVYGRQDDSGKPVGRSTLIGFFPVGGVVGLFVGMVAAPGLLGRAYLDDKMPDMNCYKRNLTPDEYRRLTDYVAREQGKTKIWNMFINNCNDFAADAARVIGLKVPFDRFLPPALFIKSLSDLNT